MNAAHATEIPGLDLTVLTPDQRVAALQRLNEESCSCGCSLTLAQCRINDTTCGFSLPLAEQVVAENHRRRVAARRRPPDTVGQRAANVSEGSERRWSRVVLEQTPARGCAGGCRRQGAERRFAGIRFLFLFSRPSAAQPAHRPLHVLQNQIRGRHQNEGDEGGEDHAERQ